MKAFVSYSRESRDLVEALTQESGAGWSATAPAHDEIVELSNARACGARVGPGDGWRIHGAALTIDDPVGPAWYLGALVLAAALAIAAAWRSRRWLTLSALVVSVLLLTFAGFFHSVAMRVPPTRTQLVVGQPAPDFTLPDAAGRPVRLADYRGRQRVVLVFYRGSW